MSATWLRRIAVAAVLFSAATGCSTTGNSPKKTSAAMRMPSLPLIGKKEDESLRKAVDKDPFPRAQGSLAAATDNAK